MDSGGELKETRELISNLQSQIKFLETRIQELELENKRLAEIGKGSAYKLTLVPKESVSEVTLNCSVVEADPSRDAHPLLSKIDGLTVVDQMHERDMDSENIDQKGLVIKKECSEGKAVEDQIWLDEMPDLFDASNGMHRRKKNSQMNYADYHLKISHQHTKRYIALKIMYLGQRFYGFASEGNKDPTVESELFKALEKTKLLVGDRKESNYSRCGRTDKGVSSVGQVVALFLRSNLKEIEGWLKSEKMNLEEAYDEKEIDYVKVLNKVLPDDIRVLGWCPIPSNFSARFSCLSREYMYLFWSNSLDISAMGKACNKFIGEHDFRNFCKMDALNVHNYRRQITEFEIVPCSQRVAGNELLAMRIKGSAFLWHQVRCVVAVLFMVGQGLESPDVIDALLDTTKTTRKPQYTMAPELPLVLRSCEFEAVDFMCSSDASQALHEHLKSEARRHMLQAVIFQEALSCVPVQDGPIFQWKTKRGHVPLNSRPTEPSYNERRSKLQKHIICENEIHSSQKQIGNQ
ncbi:tRNA pseudouridine(38/39) synthase isoform X1 [Amborella trichopoda]|uniref:tRNA pseudouridine(38/39) synthase isoform X1 n=1 Tax=Amborella trichopoda TaxID=13333 RepID=UPI0005D2D512|nr:tRNA pseudouridine(38/39) synthase isoform X1 [Amborella trichopoda]|eukprot:XP_011621926.1 tRNA pseudouridine(38/39) synthase isoform X1 [Amborella trichopoda]